MRKAQWRILPIIFLAYLVAYIDRTNISFAAASMNADLGFTATIYGRHCRVPVILSKA